MTKNLFNFSLIAIFASFLISNGAMCSRTDETNQQELTKKAQKEKMQMKGAGALPQAAY